MENTILKAFAKLNLSLNLLPARGEKGYFNVLFINTQVELHDLVHLSTAPDKVIRMNDSVIDKESNTAYRAASLMFERYRLPGGISITIYKNIPIKAGLGGGSADAAAVMSGLAGRYHLSVSADERISLAKTIGMDVCYCVIGGLCKIEGIGDRVQRLPWAMPPIDLLIATPPAIKPSTRWAYSIIKESEIGKNREKMDRLLRGIKTHNITLIAENLHNDFEPPIQHFYPVTRFIKETMLQHGALGSLLAGSGLSVFGIFKNMKNILRAREVLEKDRINCIITRTIGS